MLIDTHCHLDDPQLAGRLPALLEDAATAGVAACIVPGVSPLAWPAMLSLSESYRQVFPAFGVHPMHADLLTPTVLEELEALAPKGKAIGEIGLDYLLPSPSKEVQQRAFLAQLTLARRHRLPVLIHCRKAFKDLLALLGAERGAECGGVMHAFSGSVETARECMKLGFLISICGTVTYQNAVKPVAVARETPLSHLLLETDAPDLSPEPHRGEVNLPQHLMCTAEKVAQLKGVTVGALAEVTTANARRLFRL